MKTAVRSWASSSSARSLVSVAISTLLDASNDIVVVTATATITLPTAVGIRGKTYTIKNNGAGITVTLATTGGQTVDGAASGSVDIQMTQQYQCLTVVSDDANWLTLSRMS